MTPPFKRDWAPMHDLVLALRQRGLTRRDTAACVGITDRYVGVITAKARVEARKVDAVKVIRDELLRLSTSAATLRAVLEQN